MPSPNQYPVLLFDGHCNLCNGFVQWILRFDKKGIFRFASLQSDFGKKQLEQNGLTDASLDSVVLIHRTKAHIHSDAPLEIFRLLPFPFPLLWIFKIVPRLIRDAVYRWIARNRYRWFGKKAECMLPRPEWKERFLG